MSKSVEFFFDYVSPATYFAHVLLPKIAERTGASIVYRPFLLGGVFKAVNNVSPLTVPAKGAWFVTDLKRFSQRYGIELNFNPHFPINTIHLMRGACWVLEKGDDIFKYSDAMFKAIWVEQRNMSDPNEIATVVDSLSIDPELFMNAVAAQKIKDKLRNNTDEAVQRGAFGAPTMFVGEEMFWGQDRLDFVEEALAE